MCQVSIKFGPYLNQILAFGLRDKWLKLGCREGVHQTRLRNDEEKDLSARQDRQFVCLMMNQLCSLNRDARDDA